MAVITRYVDVDAAAGGDGTTNALTGANCAYKSLNIWEAAQQQNLDTGNNIAECICESNHANHTADTTVVTIDGWTTSATDYISIKTSAAGRHDGKWNTGKYRLEIPELWGGGALTIYENFVRVEGLQFTLIDGSYVFYTAIDYLTNGADVRISNSIYKGLLTANCTGITLATDNSSGTVSVKAWNNIMYNFSGSSAVGIYANAWLSTATLYAYNNTIYNSYSGCEIYGSSVLVAKNNISYNNTTDFSGTFDASSNYNFSKDATAPGAQSIHGTADGKTPDFVNTGAGTEDFHLQSTSDAIGVGTDNPGSGLYSTDIDGQTRTSTWDIGADEYVAVETGKYVIILKPITISTPLWAMEV